MRLSRVALRLVGPRLTAAHAGWLCLASGLALSGLGVYAIDLGTSPEASGSLVPASGLASRQMVYLAAGLVACLLVALPDPRIVRRLAWPAYAVVAGLLVFLLIPAVPRWLVSPQNGARGWITLGSVNLQPAELAKIAFVLATASYLRFRTLHRRLLGLLPVSLIGGAPVLFIIQQPDLGTAMLFAPAMVAILLAAGARLRHLALVVTIAALLAPASYPILMPHQKERILGMIAAVSGSSAGADDINFQRFAAERLVGSGGLAGVSDARCRALVHFNALPEPENDMIYAVIVARFGLAGGLGVLALYGVWLLGALATASIAKDPFGRLVVVGCSAFIAAQVLVNVGVTLGLLPIIGITLPFVSYGGSSMLTVWAMTGLVLNIASRRPVPPFRPAFEYADDDGP